MANEVEIELSIEEKKALRAIGKVIKKMDDLGDTVEEESRRSSSAWGSFVGNLGANLVSNALNRVAGAAKGLFNVFVKDGIAAAQVQEDAINALNQSLKATGDFTEEASQDLQEFASSLQKVTTQGDEATLKNLALLKSISGLTGEGLKKATVASLDMAAALGVSVESAITLVGKAAVGEIGSLSRYGLIVKRGKDNAETFSRVLETLNSQFGGAAASKVNTFSGATQQLSNSFGDLQEKFGEAIIKNEKVAEGIKELNEIINNLTKTAEEKLPGIVDKLVSISEVFTTSPTAFWMKFLNGGQEQGIDSLNVKIADMESKLKSAKEALFQLEEKEKEGGFLGTVTSFLGSVDKQKGVVDNLTNELKRLREEKSKIGADEEIMGPPKPSANELKDPANDPKVLFEQKRNELLDQIRETRKQKELELEALENEEGLLKNEAKLANLQEQAALRAEIQAQIDNDAVVQKVKTETELAKADDKFEKQFFDRKLRAEQRKQQLRQQDLQREKEYRTSLNSIANNFLNAGIMLAKEGSAAMKALQTTQAIINTYTGATNALADTRPAFLAPVAAASIIALGLANVAKINGAKFAQGGFVGGIDAPYSPTDNRMAFVGDGEFVANQAQQRRLLEGIANGTLNGGNSGGDVVVQIDGREIARVVREQKQEGYAV